MNGRRRSPDRVWSGQSSVCWGGRGKVTQSCSQRDRFTRSRVICCGSASVLSGGQALSKYVLVQWVSRETEAEGREDRNYPTNISQTPFMGSVLF